MGKRNPGRRNRQFHGMSVLLNGRTFFHARMWSSEVLLKYIGTFRMLVMYLQIACHVTFLFSLNI